MNPQLAFLALSQADNLQILRCLREHEQAIAPLSASHRAESDVDLNWLQLKTGLCIENLIEGLALLIESGLIIPKGIDDQMYYQRNEKNLAQLAELLGGETTLTQAHVDQQPAQHWFNDPVFCFT